jgi:hypothetical protein
MDGDSVAENRPPIRREIVLALRQVAELGVTRRSTAPGHRSPEYRIQCPCGQPFEAVTVTLRPEIKEDRPRAAIGPYK